MEGGNKEQAVWLLWNQVDGREKTGSYDAYQSVIGELSLPIMETRIMDSMRFRKETDDTGTYVFRSSLLPAEPQLMKATKRYLLSRGKRIKVQQERFLASDPKPIVLW